MKPGEPKQDGAHGPSVGAHRSKVRINVNSIPMFPKQRLNTGKIRENRGRARTPTKPAGNPQGRHVRAGTLPAEMNPGPKGRAPRAAIGKRSIGTRVEPGRANSTSDSNGARRRASSRQSTNGSPIDSTQLGSGNMSSGGDLMAGSLQKLIPTEQPPTFPNQVTHAIEMRR